MMSAIRCVLCIVLLASTALAQGQLRVAGRYAIEKSTDATIGAGEGLLVAADANGTVAALGADLTAKWSIKLKSGISAPPVIAEAGIILGDDTGQVALLDRTTGAQRWTFKAEGKIVGQPALVTGAPDGPRIIVGSYDTHVYCLSARDGKEIWRFKTDAQVHASPLVSGDLVIVGGCDGHLRAIALDTGKERWAADLGGAIATSPAFANDRIFAATMGAQAFAVGLDGKVLWSAKPLPQSEPITASPAIAGDLVVFVSDGGQLVSLRTVDGSMGASAKLSGKPSVNMLTLAGNVICGTEDGRVLLIDPKTGQTVHRATVGGTVGTLALVDAKVAACTSQGIIWLLDTTK